jgi:hypothetical protein
VKAALANPLAIDDARDDQQQRLRCSQGVVRGGVEPPTFRFSGGRSYQLSYLTLAAGTDRAAAPPSRAVLTGFEPATSTLTGWRALLAALQDHAALAGRQRCPQRDSNPCRRLERAVS